MDDSRRVAARGAPLTLLDGRTVTVRFGMRELSELEEQFGSMHAVQDSLATGKTFTSLCRVLAVATGIAVDDLFDLLHPAEVEAYSEVLNVALTEAFPQPPETPGNPPAGTTPGFPGLTSTTSAPSPSAALIGSSG